MSILTEHIKRHFSNSGDNRQDELLTLSLASDAVVMDLHEQLAQSREETKTAEVDASEAVQALTDNEQLTEQVAQKAFYVGCGVVNKPANDLFKIWLAYKNQEGL